MSGNHPLNRAQLIDEYFIENRTRVLEVAAFLDRLDRAGNEDDFRMRAFREALEALSGPQRVLKIQHIFSDPRPDPQDGLDRKSACGAYNRWNGGAR